MAKDLEAATNDLSLGLLVHLQAKIIRSKCIIARRNKRIKKHTITATEAVYDVLQGCDQQNLTMVNNWRKHIYKATKNNLAGTVRALMSTSTTLKKATFLQEQHTEADTTINTNDKTDKHNNNTGNGSNKQQRATAIATTPTSTSFHNNDNNSDNNNNKGNNNID